MRPILLFDIDGTLMRVKRSFMKELIGRVIAEMRLTGETVNQTSYAGRTDRDIFSQLISSQPDRKRVYEELKETYIKFMYSYFTSDHADAIAGAEDLVAFASREGYSMGLCTGNYRETAFLKVEAAGFQECFAFGGFGCNHEDRVHLPGEAHEEYVSLNGGLTSPDPSDYIIIGDTPNDVRCARYFGARAVTVSTGDYSDDELRRCEPDLHVRDLREVQAWLRAGK
ncbi:MAG: HAD family hydrolase [Balneolaceae bacterium]|jgi:phosphoglycolate phosphatase|nr:MAG: HAD family hydrolase [Balneolaceae bacterium]